MILWIALALVSLFTLVVSIYLPIFVQNRIIPDMMRKAGLPPQQVFVRHIGIKGADLGPLRIGGNNESCLQIETIRISYNLFSLWHRKINALEVIGLSVPLQINKNNLCMAGFCTQSRSTPTSQQGPLALNFENLFPIEIDTIRIKKATVAFQWQNQSLDIPLDLALNTRDAEKGNLTGSATLSPKGNTITAALTAHTGTNRADIILHAGHFRPQDFSSFWKPERPLEIIAELEIEANITLQLNPFQITDVDLSTALSQAKVSAAGMSIEGLPARQGNSPSDMDAPITISLTTTDLEQWHLTCTPLELTAPLRLQMAQIRADVYRKRHGWQLTAASRMHLPAQPIPNAVQNLSLDRSVDLDWRMTAHAKEGDMVALNATLTGGATQEEILLSCPPATLSTRQPKMEFSFSSNAKGLIAKGDVSSGPTRVHLPPGEFRCPGFDLRMAGTSAETIRIDADLLLPEPAITLGALNAKLPKAMIKAQVVRPTDHRQWQLHAQVETHEGLIQDRDKGLTVTNLSLDLPIQWPYHENDKHGSLSAEKIQWRGHHLGGLAGSLILKDQGLIGDFTHTSRLVPGLEVSAKTVVDKTGVRLNLDLPAFQPTDDFDLGRLISRAEGFRINGRFQGRAELNLTQKGLDGTARMAMDQGSISQTNGAIKLSGISTTLTFHHLPLLRSDPQQPIQIHDLQIGNIRAKDLEAKYQIEPPATLFIEKAGLKWCQGLLNSQSIRIQPDEGVLDLTIFCDQLNLAQVLTQLGVAQGSGDGTVNGRIPLHWSKSALVFGAGFLYSTPGQTGSIQLFDTKTLLQGMPKEAPQYVQLDIATEALKDYTYNWAKVNLESQSDILNVSLKLDGKPNRLLPFAYDQHRGQFLRIQGKGQAEFKGINIDLNFQIPLNQILHIKELVTSPNR